MPNAFLELCLEWDDLCRNHTATAWPKRLNNGEGQQNNRSGKFELTRKWSGIFFVHQSEIAEVKI